MKENEQQFTDIVRRNRSAIYTVWHRTNVDSHNSHEHMVINRNRLSSHCHKCRFMHQGGGRVIGVVPSLVEKGGRMSDYINVGLMEH